MAQSRRTACVLPTVFVSAAIAAAGLAQAPTVSPFVASDGMVPPTGMTVFGYGDFDGDGDIDIYGAGAPYVMLNDGSGRFAPLVASPGIIAPPYVALSFMYPGRYVVADFNADGKADVASNTNGAGAVWYSTGGPLGFVTAALPSVSSPPLNYTPLGLVGLVAGDVNGDGAADLVLRHNVTSPLGTTLAPPVVMLGQPGGGFVVAGTAGLSAIASWWDFLLVDVDLDSDLDALISGGGVYYNTAGSFGPLIAPDGGTTPVVTSYASLGLANLDGNGYPDLIETTATRVVVLLGGPSGYVTGPVLVPTVAGANLFNAAIGLDTDGDGFDELRVFRTDGRIGIYVIAAGALTPTGFEIGWGMSAFGAYDFDGDGDRDLVHADSTWGAPTLPFAAPETELTVRLNDGAGGSAAQAAFPPVLLLGGPVVGDYDGDGDLDLAGFVSEGVGSTLVIGANDGFGVFSWAPTALPPLTGGVTPGRTVAGDFDGDGDQDLYVLETTTTYPASMPAVTNGTTRMLLNQGAGVWIAGPTAVAAGTTQGVAVVADFDADGYDDVAEVARGPVSLIQLRNGSPAGLSAPVTIASIVGLNDIEAADVSGSGLPDLTYAASVCGILRNDGGGVFVMESPFGSTNAWRVSVADADGNGLKDVWLDNLLFLHYATGMVFAGVVPNGNPSFGATGTTSFDFEGDGDSDIVFESGLVLVIGAGGLLIPSSLALPFTPKCIVRDFDRDGDPDLLTIQRTVGGVGGVPKLFWNRARQLVRNSPLRPGRPAQFGLYGAAGGTYWLFAALGTAQTAIPPYGTVFLNPASTVLLVGGAFDATGAASFTATLPTSYSAFLGVEFDLQALVDTVVGPRLTNARRAVLLGY